MEVVREGLDQRIQRLSVRRLAYAQENLGGVGMSEEAKAAPSAFLAGHLALAKDRKKNLARYRATIDLARQLLTDEEIQPYATGKTLCSRGSG